VVMETRAADVDELAVSLDGLGKPWELYRGWDRSWKARATVRAAQGGEPAQDVTVSGWSIREALVGLLMAVAAWKPPVPPRPTIPRPEIRRGNAGSLRWEVWSNGSFDHRFQTKRAAEDFIARVVARTVEATEAWDRQYGAGA